MTQSQFNYIVKLSGGLNEAGAAAVDFGVLDFARSNKKDRTNALLSISTADASRLIEHLGGPALNAPRVRPQPGAESAEENGYMVDRGEDN